MMTKDEALAAAGVNFNADLWDRLEKDDDGRVSVDVLTRTMKKYAASAPAPTPAGGETAGTVASVAVPEGPKATAAKAARVRSVNYVYPGEAHKDLQEDVDPRMLALKPPPELPAADVVLCKLNRLLAVEGDRRTSGFGRTYKAPTVNYFTQFRKLDTDHNRIIERDEWVHSLRGVVGVTKEQVSDKDLMKLFDAIDEDKSGGITLNEWAAFAKGAQGACNFDDGPYQYGPCQSAASPVDDVPLAYFPRDDNKEDANVMPRYSDKKVVQHRNGADYNEPEGLDALHLVLWHLANHVRGDSGADSTNMVHPGYVSYHSMFKVLDIDKNNNISRKEWALVLRRHVGVGPCVTDDDLLHLFNAIDTDKSNGISLAEFAAFARGAAGHTHARGLAHTARAVQKMRRLRAAKRPN